MADAVAPLHPTCGANGRGIGPYDEKPFVLMLREQLGRFDPYCGTSAAQVSYPGTLETVDFLSRLCRWDWAIELIRAHEAKQFSGYDCPVPLAPLVSEFETLARKRVNLTQFGSAGFVASPTADLHSIHSRGLIAAWRVEPFGTSTSVGSSILPLGTKNEPGWHPSWRWHLQNESSIAPAVVIPLAE